MDKFLISIQDNYDIIMRTFRFYNDFYYNKQYNQRHTLPTFSKHKYVCPVDTQCGLTGDMLIYLMTGKQVTSVNHKLHEISINSETLYDTFFPGHKVIFIESDGQYYCFNPLLMSIHPLSENYQRLSLNLILKSIMKDFFFLTIRSIKLAMKLSPGLIMKKNLQQ